MPADCTSRRGQSKPGTINDIEDHAAVDAAEQRSARALGDAASCRRRCGASLQMPAMASTDPFGFHCIVQSSGRDRYSAGHDLAIRLESVSARSGGAK